MKLPADDSCTAVEAAAVDTDRDITTSVVAESAVPETTSVGDVYSRDFISAEPNNDLARPTPGRTVGAGRPSSSKKTRAAFLKAAVAPTKQINASTLFQP